MKILRSIARTIQYSFQHIMRNGFQSLSILLLLSITFLIGQLFGVVTIASDTMLKYFENQPQVMVFFKDEATEDQIKQIKTELEKEDYVETVSYISKEQALEIYRNRHSEQLELLEFVTVDMLPASIGVSVNKADYLFTVADLFEDNQFVESVVFQKDLVEEVLAFSDALRMAGMVLLGILMFNVIVLIFLVVSNNIKAFGKEIEVMRLVGAGANYVRFPFVFDSMLLAIIASGISTLGLAWVLPYVQEFSNQFIAEYVLFPDTTSLLIKFLGVTALGGALFSAIISYVATWRHIRV